MSKGGMHRRLGRFRPGRWFRIGSGLLMAVVASILWWPASTPPILGADGKPRAGSVASLETIKLGGVDQWVLIRGNDTRNPILVFLAGGPGGSAMGLRRIYDSELEKHFVVVNWDQRGAAKSYPVALMDRGHMTVDGYVSDGVELLEKLTTRFGQRKIYLVGQSWGTILGVLMAQRRPDLVAAYVGVAQVPSPLRVDQEIYRYIHERATRENRPDVIAALEKNGPPPFTGWGMQLRYADLFHGALSDWEQDAMRASGNDMQRLSMDGIEASEYRNIDRVYFMAGMVDTFGLMYAQIQDVDLEQTAARLEVPVYFATGRWDLNVPTNLQQQYFDKLIAPDKQLVWFERSGHAPWTSEHEAFDRLLIDKVLPETGTASTAAGANEGDATEIVGLGSKD